MSLSFDTSRLVGLRDAAAKLIGGEPLKMMQGGSGGIREKAQKGAGLEALYDVVTDIDLAIESYLLARLETLLSGSRALGEEGFKRLDNPAEQPIWLLDPLDGTLNFARGLPGYGLSLALFIEARPVMGLVMDGASGALYDAVEGMGARFSGQPIKMNDKDSGGAPLCLSSGVWNLVSRSGDAAILPKILQLNPRIRLIGSQALQLCFVASGALCLNVNREARLWDDAAGALIVREAGGSYEQLSGHSMFPLKDDDPALRGESLFSLAGTPDLVYKAKQLFAPIV